MTMLDGSRSNRLARAFLLCLVLSFSVSTVLCTPLAAHAADEPKKGEKDEGPKDTNIFLHIIFSAGPVFGPLLLVVSIILVSLIVLLAMDLRMGVAVPGGFVDEFADMVN